MTSSAEIAAIIRRRIQSGELEPGEKVPSARQITRKWGVAIATASKALSILKSEGLVRATRGAGTVVDGGLSKTKIVATALWIADHEGLAAVSMRRIAHELGASTMSLYRHVSNKEDLVLLVADAVFAEEPPPVDRAQSWRERAELGARVQWKIYRRHPWLAGAMSITRPQLVPHGMAHTEYLLKTLDGHGLDHETMLTIALTVIGYVRGVATNLEMETQAEHDSGVDADAYIAAQAAAFYALAKDGAFPILARVSAESDLDLGLDRLFDFGLKFLLDGLATFIERSNKP